MTDATARGKARQIAGNPFFAHWQDGCDYGTKVLSQRVLDLTAAWQQALFDLQNANVRLANLTDPKKSAWTDEARAACKAFERQFDVEVVSIEHHAEWVERAEAAERERDEARQGHAIARKWCDQLEAGGARETERAESAERRNADLAAALNQMTIMRDMCAAGVTECQEAVRAGNDAVARNADLARRNADLEQMLERYGFKRLMPPASPLDDNADRPPEELSQREALR